MKQPTDNSLITLRNIRKKRQQRFVLDNISLEITKGQCLVVLGENGSGKTTLLQILAKVLKPDQGEVIYANQLSVGFVPQEDGFFEEVTALDNLKLWVKDDKSWQNSPYLIRLGLQDFLDKPVRQLSGGMKRRLSLACCLIHNPQVVVLDEPFSSLDVLYQQELRLFINELLDEDKTIVLSTHEAIGYSLGTERFWLDQGKLEPLEAGLAYTQLYQRIHKGGR